MASRSEGDLPLSCPSLVAWWDVHRTLLPTSTLGTPRDEPPRAGAGMDGCGRWDLASSTVSLLSL